MTCQHADQAESVAVSEVCCESAMDFLERISPWGDFLRNQSIQVLSEPWVFRGHSNSDWPLLASALRPKSDLITAEASGWSPIRTVKRKPAPEKQARSELYTLRAFALLADGQGLSLPEDTQTLRVLLRDPSAYIEKLTNEARRSEGRQEQSPPWPPAELLSLMALAQHYGIPTRLLDWSYNVFVATYFACVDAAKEWTQLAGTTERRLGSARRKRRDTGRLELWALNLYQTTPSRMVPVRNAPMVVVTAPGAGIANLRAQEGLFTVDNPELFEWGSATVPEPLQERIARGRFTDQVLRGFQLEIRHAPELRKLLARDRLTGARCFPGYDGVVKALRERRWHARN